MKKRILSLVLAFMMIFTLSPLPTYAVDDLVEQFSLSDIGTYYFDLSGQALPGTVDESLPDASLKWVPFTYVGTINAYSRTSEGVSTDVSVSNRSLFVADYNVTFGVCWNDLNAAGLIFGNDYSSGSVSYKLRSLSTGSDFFRTTEDEIRGLPESNEWDQILNKNENYIKNLTTYYTLGQDTYEEDPLRCTARGHELSAREYFTPKFEEIISLPNQEFGYRPVLEILNSDTLGTDGLKTVTYDISGNGTLGKDELTSATVVYTGRLTLPEITPENGFNITGSESGSLGWFDGSTYYAPGETLNLATGASFTAAYYTGPGTAPTITTSSLPAGRVNTAYSQTLAATGDTPIKWSINDGTLPPGLTFSEDGVISGIPTEKGNFGFTVKAENSTSVATKLLGIKIEAEKTGGGTRDGLDSGIKNKDIVSIPTENRPDQPIIAEFTAAPTEDNNGHATVSIPQQSVEDAIAKAQAAAKAQGKTANGIGISVKIDMPDTAKSLGVTLPMATLNSLVNAGVKSLEIDGVILSLDFDLEALKEIQKQGIDDVTITVKPAQNLPDSAKKLIGDRPVYDVTISYIREGETVNITSLGSGSCYISFPYTPKKGEAIDRFTGVSITSDQKLSAIYLAVFNRSNNEYLGASFGLFANHFSIFGIGYIPPTEGYTDVADHWDFESIDYVMGRGLFAGTSATTFSPDIAMDRGMLITVLGRMAGADVSAYTTSSFSDVAEGTYYLPYIEWAYKKGIISGIGNGKFAPERAATREEIALILQNYAKATGYVLPVTCEAVDFADSIAIPGIYKEAVKAVQQSGIMEGDLNNHFNPKVGATRAEVASMLHHYINLTIDPATAHGWAKYDDGRWFYFKDGKPLIGWQTIDGSRYFFHTNGTLQTGWVKDGDNWRFYDNAMMVSDDWFLIDGKWYYFYEDGHLAVSTSIDGYEVDENGARKMK